jgi:hypothetical protein
MTDVALFKAMVEQIVSGDGVSGAASLAADESPATKAAARKHAERALLGASVLNAPPDVQAAMKKVISLLSAPPAALKAAAKGGSNTKLYLLGGAGLVAVWFFLIRKKN